ncbi:MAG: phage terminase large subunit [archaeon]
MTKKTQNYQIFMKWKSVWEKSKNNPDYLKYLWESMRAVNQNDPELGFQLNKYIRGECLIGAKNVSEINKRKKFFEIYRKALLLDAPRDFDAFCLYSEIDRKPKDRFYQPRRKQLYDVSQDLNDLYNGDLELLSISMPPGVGKSTLGIFFLVWVMLLDPLAPNLATGHSSKLVRSFYKGALELLQDDEYRVFDPFPASKLVQTSADDLSVDLLKINRYPTLTCRSIEGSLTGVTRTENILYADDLVSGIEVAMSKDRLDTLWFRYTNDLRNRKKNNAKELHIATRWSVHDPIGRLERIHMDDPKAKFISKPALDENEESNFDYPYDVGFDTQYFLTMREIMDDVGWRALFMNEPIEREGVVYHIDDLNRYYDLPEDDPDMIVGACDPAEGGGDSTCLVIGYIYGDSVYIEDVIFNNGLPEVTKPLMVKILMKHKVQSCVFESNSAGGEIATSVQERIKEKGGKTRIIKKRTTSNKQTRIIMASDDIKENFHFKDKSRLKGHGEYLKYLKELTEYSHVGRNKHDDAPDGTTQLKEFLDSMQKTKVLPLKRPF